MKSDLENLMHIYTARYSQQVRDVVETFSSGTTRLGNAPAMPVLAEADVRAIALKHALDGETLISAVIDYAAIEALSEQAVRRRDSRFEDGAA